MKPARTITVWATMAIVPMISLKLVDTLIPRTLSQIRSRIPATDSSSHSHARCMVPIGERKVAVKSPM